MRQVVDSEIGSLRNVLENFQLQVGSMPVSSTSVRYQRVVESLQSSLFSLHPSLDSSPFTLDSLQLCCTDWLINQWLLQTPFTTASLYLDIISALYGSAVKARRLPKTDLFSKLKAQLKQLGPDGWKSGIDDEIFARALRLTKNAANLISDDAIAADLLLLSLTQSGTDSILRSAPILNNALRADTRYSLLPLEQLALLQKDASASSASPALLRDIISRHGGSARRKFIFPLRQSGRTDAQLKKHVFKIVNDLFRRARLPQATDPNQTVEALWAYAALRAGIPASAVVAVLGHAPLGLPVLKLEAPQPPEGGVSLDTVAPPSGGWGASIGKIFLDNPPRWYALSLRPGVRFTQLSRRIETLQAPRPPKGGVSKASLTPPLGGRGASLASLSLFYPCEEIARAIGKKIVIKQRPFIHSVVFFKAKLTDIGRLFAKIGDLAWCYRQSAAPAAPYAAISQKEFERFQQTIATFTPDYEVAPTGELELKKNDRVQILGGLFAGHEATFEGEAPRPPKGGALLNSPLGAGGLTPPSGGRGASTVYRLNIIGDNGIEWRIGIDKRLAKQKN